MELSQTGSEHTYDTLTSENRSQRTSPENIQPILLKDSKYGSKIGNIPLKILVYVQIVINIVLLSGLIIGFCIFTTVKVHGNWSQWSPWLPCDVMSGNGSQTRFRTCTSPPPAGGGQQCAGHWQETKYCQTDIFLGNGNWSEWSPWSLCDVTCGNGSQTRFRSCTHGQNCTGDLDDTKACNLNSCTVVSWSEWNQWSSCDVTCGNGLQTRIRTCTNRLLVSSGQDCTGNKSDIKFCHLTPCAELKAKVAFTAYGIKDVNSSLVFSDVSINFGNGYDNSTGIFTCQVPGIYHFALQVSKAKNVFARDVTCSIMVNNQAELSASEEPFLNDVNNRNGYSLSLTGTFHLKKNDTASVQCNNLKVLSGARLCSFTGFLVTSDN